MRLLFLAPTIVLLVVALSACGTSRSATQSALVNESETNGGTVQPGAPGEATGPVRIVDPEDGSQRAHTDADTRFMQGMIAHHAQALEMTAMVPSRSDANDFRLLSRRIEESQRTEIALMQRWLRERGEMIPDATGDSHHGMGHSHGMQMPGMLTRDQLDELETSTGDEFERLFLTYMISHHEGALVMVSNLFSVDGAGQDGEIFRFASDVDSDQRMEIARMRAMLELYQNYNNSEGE
ncbi:MAG: DUF305 domain-containing protein [Rhodothermales bacterium]|nr:DUF305 domain-containing protein [Rhodothermales bacterium]